MNERDGTDRDARRRQLALFRHAIIGELDIEKLPRGERSARITDLAGRTYELPRMVARGSSVPAPCGPGGAPISAKGSKACCPKRAPIVGRCARSPRRSWPRRSGFGKRFPHARPPR